MKREALNTFLSSENINMHCNYLKQLRLKLSIIKKSYPDIICENFVLKKHRPLKRIPETVVYETRILFYSIKMHELFFESFTTQKRKYPQIRQQFSSEEAFLYELYDLVKNEEYGYAFVYINEKGRIGISLTDVADIFERYKPLLVIDLYEHSYFYDYFYDKDSYYRKAIDSLDLGKIEDALTSS